MITLCACNYKQVHGGVWRNNDREAWVPDQVKQLHHLLCVVTHQGPSGHRGRDTTMKLLRGRVRWNTIRDDVNL